MPLKGTPVCIQCNKSESPMWTSAAENLGALCLDCVNEAKQDRDKVDDDIENPINGTAEQQENGVEITNGNKRKLRRFYKTRHNPFALPKTQQPKGRGRRGLFKKQPMKAPTSVATPVTSDSVFYKNTYFQIGDIVSLIDLEGDTYYAQLRGFLTDQYCEKSAVITWLLPTVDSPPPDKAFDPTTYIVGPDEELPRKLDCMEFVMHAPSDYYKCKDSPYAQVGVPVAPGFIWTSLESVKRLKRGEL